MGFLRPAHNGLGFQDYGASVMTGIGKFGFPRWLRKLSPGLITGAADDDPSGIATYSQAGAQFGFGLLWTMLLTYPLMSAIQIVSARIGRVTGCGLAANLRAVWPRPSKACRIST